MMKENIANLAINLIKDGQTIGLGGGRNVSLIVKSLEKSSLKHIRIVTVSNETKTLCEQMGLNLVEFEEVDQIDWTFDGCDWINRKFQALKTRGGIQTEEKMLAQVSKHYVLLVTKDKLYDPKKTELPICCEILPNSIKVIRKKLLNYNADFNLRISNNMPIKTRHGNYLIDVQWKNSDIPEYISTVLDSLAGIVSHSFFLNEITEVLYNDDNVKHIHKNREREEEEWENIIGEL